MADVTKRFCWAESVRAILHHFSTPEVKTLHRQCRQLIRDYCNAAVEGEGYAASIIAFEMFEYGFVFAYSEEAELWVLEVVAFPDFGSPQCRRKPPREDGRSERVAAHEEALRRPLRGWLRQLLRVLYKNLGQGQTLTAFFADTSSGGDAEPLLSLLRVLRTMREMQSRPRPASHIIQLFKNLAEQQSHYYADVVQLVRVKVNEAASFLDPLWSFQLRLRRASLDGPWDVNLFGALPEQASG